MSRGGFVLVSLMVVACGGAQSAPQPQTSVPPVSGGRAPGDSAKPNTVPAGFGTIKQDDISIILETEGVRVAAIPLDESVIVTLAPDSYRSLRLRLDSKRQTIAQRASMRGIREPRVWNVRFFGRAPDARFVPTDLTVTSGGREFRPFDVIPITPGFGEHRLQPRDEQVCLLLFDEGLDVSQPVVVAMGSVRNTEWDWNGSSAILTKLETERANIRARAASKP